MESLWANDSSGGVLPAWVHREAAHLFNLSYSLAGWRRMWLDELQPFSPLQGKVKVSEADSRALWRRSNSCYRAWHNPESPSFRLSLVVTFRRWQIRVDLHPGCRVCYHFLRCPMWRSRLGPFRAGSSLTFQLGCKWKQTDICTHQGCTSYVDFVLCNHWTMNEGRLIIHIKDKTQAPATEEGATRPG